MFMVAEVGGKELVQPKYEGRRLQVIIETEEIANVPANARLMHEVPATKISQRNHATALSRAVL